MKILKKSMRQGRILLNAESLDDLWHLSQIIGKDDLVRGKTTRKVKATEKETAKKTLTLTIKAEEIDFKDRALRISGVTTEELEDIPKGSHHTITVEEGSVLSVTKESWPQYSLKRLQQAAARQTKALILVLDREEAVFALLKSQGYEVLSQIKGKVAKKGVETAVANFYKELADSLEEYAKRFSAERIIVASPAFWKEDFIKEVGDDLRGKIVLATCSSVGTTAIDEVLKRPELREVLKQQRAAHEAMIVDELMAEIAKDNLAAYGRKQVADAVSSGNARQLLITDAFIHENRAKAEDLMRNSEAINGEVVIINSENDAGRKLDSLGGIAVLLRYKAYQ